MALLRWHRQCSFALQSGYCNPSITSPDTLSFLFSLSGTQKNRTNNCLIFFWLKIIMVADNNAASGRWIIAIREALCAALITGTIESLICNLGKDVLYYIFVALNGHDVKSPRNKDPESWNREKRFKMLAAARVALQIWLINFIIPLPLFKHQKIKTINLFYSHLRGNSIYYIVFNLLNCIIW